MPVDPWTSPRAYTTTRSIAGEFMAQVYRWMAAGLGVTGIVAMAVASNPEARRIFIQSPGVSLVLLLVQFGLVFGISAAMQRATFATVATLFMVFAATMGLSLSGIFLAYTGQSLAQTFFVTGGAFLGLSAYGTLTKRDLSGMRGFLMMGLIGIILASLANFFFHSSAMQFVITCAGVVVFSGLTAYDTQRILRMADTGESRLAIGGALQLYLDFLNLFLFLLQLFGGERRRD